MRGAAAGLRIAATPPHPARFARRPRPAGGARWQILPVLAARFRAGASDPKCQMPPEGKRGLLFDLPFATAAKGSGTPASVSSKTSALTARRRAKRARPPAGVPPRLSPRGLTSPEARPEPGFLGRGRSVRLLLSPPNRGRRPCAARGVARAGLSQSSEHLTRRS